MASKRRLRRKACEGKRRHADEAGARVEVAKARVRGLHAYQCPHCSGWHVGHPPARVRQGLAAKRRNEAAHRGRLEP